MKALLKRLKQHSFSRKISTWIFLVMSKLPTKKNVVIFESFSGKQYSCNPRAIYEYMKEYHQDFDLIWSVNKQSESLFQKANIPYVKRLSLKWFIQVATAGYWVTNSRMPSWVPKPKHTTYFQTWHGTPLKRLVADMEEVHMPGTDRESYIKGFHDEAKHWDYLLSPNQYSTEIFRRAFDYRGEVIEVGYPRNDDLVNLNRENDISELKQQYGIPSSKKVILYAPTWRDNDYHGPGSYKFKLQLDLSLLQKELGDEYVVILRMHSFISDTLDTSKYEGFVYDLSKGIDITNLYLMADLLITDYSSVFFDYAILKRPILFFTYDIELYRGKIRGFYFDLEKEAPGPLVMNTKQIIEEIKMIDDGVNEQTEQKLQAFVDRFCYLEEGSSARQAVDVVFGSRS